MGFIVKATAVGVVLIATVSASAATSEVSPFEPPAIQDPTEIAPYEEEFELSDPEVWQYAEHYGISRERALVIATWMSEAAAQIESLAVDLEGNFAEARLVHGGSRGGPLDDPTLEPGQLRLEIRLKDPNQSRALNVLEALPVENQIDVAVLRVPRSLQELQEEAARLPDVLPDGTNALVRFDFDGGTVSLERAERPRNYEHATCSVSGPSGGNLDGSRAVFIYGSGCTPIAECTAGFPARFNGNLGYVTAGHCFSDVGIPSSSNGRVVGSDWRNNMHWVHQPNDIYVSARSYWFRRTTSSDVGFASRRFSSTGSPGQLWKWDTGEWRRIERYSQLARGLGMTICIAASSNTSNGAGTYCGIVTDQFVNVYDRPGENWSEYDAFQAPFGKAITPKVGASGSPAWYGDTVYGIYTGHDGNRWGYYFRTSVIRNQMEGVYSGNDFYFICWESRNCGLS